MSLSIPYTFIGGPGNKARASEVNANFLAVASKFTEGVGGISDGDCSVSMGLKGSKISNVPGNRVPTDRIEDDAIDKDKLRDDATSGSPNAGVNTGDHIRDSIILNKKLAANTLALDRMKVTVSSYVWAAGDTSTPKTITANLFSPVLPAVGAGTPIAIWVEGGAYPISGTVALILALLKNTSSGNLEVVGSGFPAINPVGATIKVAWIAATNP